MGRSETRVFKLISGSAAVCILVYAALQSYDYYAIDEKKNVVELLRLNEMAISVYSILVGHGYLQYGGCGWGVSHRLRYYLHLISSSCELKGPIVLAYMQSFPVVNKPLTGSGKKGAEQAVGGTSRINMDKKSDKGERQNEILP